jgi:hypothetical protein
MADFVTIRVLMENHLPIYTVVLSILYKVNSTIHSKPVIIVAHME